MRTYNERNQDSINALKRNMRRVYENQIDALLNFVNEDDNYNDEMVSADYIRFFEDNQSSHYNNYTTFDKDMAKCVNIYFDKLGGDDLYSRLKSNTSDYPYDLSEAKLDNEFMVKVGKTSAKLLNYLKTRISARIMVNSRKEIDERRKGITERIEQAHKYPHNLRPPMSQGRLYGEKTRTPRRRTPAKKCPVRVDFRKML